MSTIKIAPSLICMNFLNTRGEITALNQLADVYHFDIIDYHFTRTFGLPLEFLISVKKIATIPIDIHLMVDDVEAILDKLIEARVNMITLPIESIVSSAFRVIDKIQNANIKIGIAINPITPIESVEYVLDIVDKITVLTFDPGVAGQKLVDVTLKKISKLSLLKKENSYLFDIEADGSCNAENYQKMKMAGITQCVVGTSGLFGLDRDINLAWAKMKEFMTNEDIYRK